MSSVSIRNLDLNFESVKVLKQLNLDIPEGEFLVLLGASGCGKSTLLNCIAGLLDISGGQIFINDRNVTWLEPSERGIGMVFQSYALYPQMSVEGNLSFGLKNAKVPKDEIAKRIERAADILQMKDLLKRKPGALSGGQRQRVAIGRALVRDVDVFLFDEPLSNLDAKLRADLRVEIKRLHNQLGNTMIYVTHDQVEAMTLADRIAIMRGGLIQQLGTPDEIYNHPANKYVADFIGSPSMNFIDGKLEDGQFCFADIKVPTDVYPYTTDARSGDVCLGIRPEHVIVGEGAEKLPYQTELEVELFEPMGSDTQIWTKWGGQSFRIRVDGQLKVANGDKLKVGIKIERCSMFDIKTELPM
ncbi:ABC transporter ATP-binding protein [Alginatibacterium sediminis]|uniref:ABC transporter ATP-binding protein n=1 Tax=Alginatibacterium sediminis TaxID=2164068 RepID=A0A420EG49_9ALTE|nr:ABC transporter ATP-binding protein [Alginatibacterium sediminis]RKF19682.1 ABC transporter ATP-binding protein [Alginatibacterium sediminis]